MKPSQLIKWRKKAGLTQEALGKRLGVTKTTVYRWEKAMREIPPFLHLALECMEKKGGKKKQGTTKTKKERKVKRNGPDL